MDGFICASCGERHLLPTSFGAEAPASYLALPEDERSTRALLSSDQCIIDDQWFFVRGLIELPIVGTDQVFGWGVWVSVSEKSFRRIAELWETEGREREPPCFGWLNTWLPGYPNTLSLKTMVHTRPVGVRPCVELEPTDHPLALEQRNGVTWDRVRAIATALMHPD